MDLPVTDQGNKHVVVFQDYFSKWPMVFAVPCSVIRIDNDL